MPRLVFTMLLASALSYSTALPNTMSPNTDEAPAFLSVIPEGNLLLPLTSTAHAHSPEITLTPSIVESGSPELIKISAPSSAKLEGQWQGHQLEFFRGADKDSWYALAGVDVEATPGPSKIAITLHARDTTRQISSTIEIHPAHYRTGALTVPPKFVEPDPEALKIIEAESKLKHQVFEEEQSRASGPPLWSGSFLAPVTAQPTDSFGTRRTFNGKLASIHKGMDFRAPLGTPVHAGNSGTVILAQQLYYEGNCVMIDHGQGLISISMHFSRIDVKPGQQVTKGQQIGLSGATGRVTGPHLHWSIRWQGANLDPAKLLQLNLDNLR